ncbi:MAG: hypothetical protein ACI9U6_003708, partial [Loktanella salsilacus]
MTCNGKKQRDTESDRTAGFDWANSVAKSDLQDFMKPFGSI